MYAIRSYYELPASVLPIPHMVLRETEDTLRIAGLLSHRIAVNSENEQFDIYYTDDIPVKKPNITTPYSNVDYPLSDFRVTLSHLRMRLIISEHRNEILPPHFYEISYNFV